MSAKPHARQLLIRQVLNHLEKSWITAKQVLAEVSAAFHEIFLILAVADFAQAPDQQAIAIVLDQRVPVGAPDYLDDVPARSPENGFQFLHDLSIAAHRSIEPLQIAIDHKNQVVELLTGCQRD